MSTENQTLNTQLTGSALTTNLAEPSSYSLAETTGTSHVSERVTHGSMNAPNLEALATEFVESSVEQSAITPQIEWIRQFGSVNSPSPRDIGKDIVVAGDDTLIAGGESGGNGFLAKYSLAGDQVWLAELATDRPDTIEAIAVDEASIFVAGTTGGSLDNVGTGLGNDAFIAKYDLSGNLQWVNQIGTDRTDQGYGVEVDTQGNAYLTGSTRGTFDGNQSGGGRDAFLSKFNNDGDLLWTQQLALSGSQEGTVVATDEGQNIYIAGSQGSSGGFAARFDASGQQQWNEQIDAFSYVRDLEISSGGDLYLGGATRSVLSDAVIKKLDADGNLIWSQAIATPQNDFIESLSIGTDGTVYAAGSTRGELGDTSFGNADLFLTSYDSGGNLNWVEQFGSPQNDSANGLALDSQSNFYIAGGTFGDLEGANAGSSDVFIAKFGNVGSGDVDLTGASFEVMQKPLAAAEEFDIEFVVENLGSTVASAFKVDFYLSEDAEITSEDYFLSDYDVNFLAGEDSTGVLSDRLTLPGADDPFLSELGDATYYIGMIVDADSSVIETDEANNANRGVLFDLDAVPVKLEIDEDNIIDLQVRTINVQGRETKSLRVIQDPFEQRNLTVNLGIENVGNVPAAAHTVQIYLSADERIDDSDRVLETLAFPEIAPAEVVGRELNLSLPDANDPFWNARGDGEYYVGILIDSNNANDERRESNNTEFAAIRIVDTPTIDLSPIDFLVLQSPENEKEIGVDFRVQNTGPTPVGQFDIAFYLSRDSAIDAGDLLIDSITVDGLSGNNFTAPIGQGIRLPGSRDAWWGGELQNPGGDTYYVGVVIDPENEISETNESNNFSQQLGQILIQDVKKPSTIDLVDDLGLTGEPISIGNGMWFLGRGVAPQDLSLDKPFLTDAADTINADTVWSAEGLSGEGFTVGVWEANDPNGNWRVGDAHIHFSNVDVQAGEDGGINPSNHATEVAGVITGQSNGLDRGIANQADIISYSSGNMLNELRDAANDPDQPVLFSNHSYGAFTGWDAAGGDANDLNALATIINPMALPPGQLFDIWRGDYAISAQEDFDFGKYGNGSSALDALLFTEPELLSVWAAGNDRNNSYRTLFPGNYITFFGSDPIVRGFGWIGPGWYWVDPNVVAPPGQDGGANGFDSIPNGSLSGLIDEGLLTGGQTAKNTLVVGSIDDINVDPYTPANVSLSSFSSWGPTDDGRIRPDVVANGQDVRMPTIGANNSTYTVDRGTSFAAPSVTGAAVLLAEQYINERGQHPRSATTKGIFIHTARDAGNPGPDYSHGWGVVDLQAAVDFVSDGTSSNPFATSDIRENTYSGEPQTFLYSNNGNQPLKVTIAWTDPAGTPHMANTLDQSTPVLVNDLDIKVIGPDGTTYFPWTLDPANPSGGAVRGNAENAEPNRLDNVEQVLIDATDTLPGLYQVIVEHNPDAAPFNQDYSLLVSGGNSFENNVTLTINRVKGDFDRGILRTLNRGDSDFFARINIDGQEYVTDVVREDSDLILDNASFETPSWIFTKRTTERFVPIKIEIFDADRGGLGDRFFRNNSDTVDIDPDPGDETLEFMFDLFNLSLSGDGTDGFRAGEEVYIRGGGDTEVGEIWFTVRQSFPTPLI